MAKLLQTPRMVAWAARHGLAHEQHPYCLNRLVGRRCRGEHYGGTGVPGHGWRQYNLEDDHVTLWSVIRSKPTIYVYTFHEYGVGLPAVPTTTIDSDRGLRCTVYPLSWYRTDTAMHVVTLDSVDLLFPYEGELPTDMADFLTKYRAIKGTPYTGRTSTEVWADFLADHNALYK